MQLMVTFLVHKHGIKVKCWYEKDGADHCHHLDWVEVQIMELLAPMYASLPLLMFLA